MAVRSRFEATCFRAVFSVKLWSEEEGFRRIPKCLAFDSWNRCRQGRIQVVKERGMKYRGTGSLPPWDGFWYHEGALFQGWCRPSTPILAVCNAFSNIANQNNNTKLVGKGIISLGAASQIPMSLPEIFSKIYFRAGRLWRIFRTNICPQLCVFSSYKDD